MNRIAIFLLPLALVACQSGPDRSPGGIGTATTPTNVQGAQEVGRDQGTASATEGVTVSNTVTPTIVNAFGVKSLKIQRGPDGEESIEMTGSEGELIIEGGLNAGVHIGEGQTGTGSSGGGAAGGVGGATDGGS